MTLPLSFKTLNRPPVILQVIPELIGGGAERGCVDIARALIKAGATSLVSSAGGPMVEEVTAGGALHITLPLNSKNPWTIWKNAGRLEKVIRQYGVTIVHARSRAPAWSAWLACRRTNTAFMTTFHAAYAFKSPLKKRYNAVMTKGQRIIAISRFIQDHIIASYDVDPSKIRLIPRGIDLSAFDPTAVSPERLEKLAAQWNVPRDKKIVLLPGRLSVGKGQSVLIEALHRLPQHELCALLVGRPQGKGTYRQHLLDLIGTYQLNNTVKILDQCSDMPAAYALADVVVSTSLYPEAFGRTIVEAQAMGRPVIVTQKGAWAETIVPGVTGWAVPPNDPETLAQTLSKVLSLSIEERHSIAQAGIHHVRHHFDAQAMVNATLAIYAELASGSKPL